MTPNTTKIIVTGDICIDWLHYPTKPKDQGLNWELHPGTRMIAKPGGALLLADILDNSTDASVVSPQLENIENIPPEEVLHSNAELDLFPYSSDP
ncbi:MAG: Ryanodine receptor Ryr, partial [Deltaproteobacteria bacterium]|nr:Ryanodine receptor Ryr [Deltaproteobacteria bacterium]